MTKEQIEKKAEEIAWQTSKHYDPNACKQEWCQMAAMDMACWLFSHQWVSVEDELPPPMSKCDPISDRVFVHTSSDCVFVDHYDHYYNEWLTAKRDNIDVTHWMPIPPLTKEGGKI